MTLKVGVLGTGNVSGIYFENDRLFKDISIVACSDIVPEAAQRAADKYGVSALSINDLLANDDVDIIVNLTIPEVHGAVSRQILEAGKHVYSEKPLAVELGEAEQLVLLARTKGLRVGCAPDTVLGAGVQRARQMIDEGAIGRPLSANMAVMSHGMEAWHPNPHFFFQPGAGPILDIGPYYISALVNILGPVERVIAAGQIGFAERVVGADGPHKGEHIPVNTPTTVHSILTFKSGLQAAYLASWDVWDHGMKPIELHGETASMRVPDPNFFGGDIEISQGRNNWVTTDTSDSAVGALNWPEGNPREANYRGLGLAEMATAIKENRPHRASGEIALHSLAVMLGILEAAETGKPVMINQQCERPAPLGEEEARALLAA